MKPLLLLLLLLPFCVSGQGNNTVPPGTLSMRVQYVDMNEAASLSNIVARKIAGQTVELGSGIFNVGSRSLKIPPGVVLMGQGPERTIIRSDVPMTANPCVQMMSTSTVARLTVECNSRGTFAQCGIGALVAVGNAAATNVTIREVRVVGESDTVVFSHTSFCSGKMLNSTFESKWDNLILEDQTADGLVGSVWRLEQVNILNDSAGNTLTAATNPVPFRASEAYVELLGCTITATNGYNGTALMLGGATNWIWLRGGSVFIACTNKSDLLENSLDPNSLVCTFDNVATTRTNMTSGSAARWNGFFTATATLDFPTTGIQSDTNLVISVPGAAPGDVVLLSIPTAAAVIPTACFTAWASNNSVVVRFLNAGAAARDPASGVFRVTVQKFP